jgi:hypothetical protein
MRWLRIKNKQKYYSSSDLSIKLSVTNWGGIIENTNQFLKIEVSIRRKEKILGASYLIWE